MTCEEVVIDSSLGRPISDSTIEMRLTCVAEAVGAGALPMLVRSCGYRKIDEFIGAWFDNRLSVALPRLLHVA